MKNVIGWIILISAICFYSYGVGNAIVISWPTTPSADELKIAAPLDSFTTALSAILLTNFGLALGISLTARQSSLARTMGLYRPQVSIPIPPPPAIKEKIQFFAVLVYLLSLIACLITWGHNDFSTNPKEVVPLVFQAGNTFFAVLTAYIASLMA